MLYSNLNAYFTVIESFDYTNTHQPIINLFFTGGMHFAVVEDYLYLNPQDTQGKEDAVSPK